MFYTDSLAYVNNFSEAYITQNVAAVARAIEPAAVTLLSLYVILWGVASLRGMIEEPITDAAARIIKIALIFGIGIQLGHYNELVIDTFFNAPEQLARALTGGTDNASVISSLDKVFASGFQVGRVFWEKGGILSGDFGMSLIGFVVWLVTLAVTVYAAALIIIAKIALTLIIIVGPLFIISLLFQPTAGYFSGWIQQLANYALLIFLVIGANVLIITLFARAADGALALSSTGQIDQIFPMLATGVLSLLVLAQLPTVASGLAGGLSLSGYGMGRMGLAVLSRTATNTAGKLARITQKRRRPKNKEPRGASPSWAAYENRDRNSIGPG
jgi:type IV secretion system protein VirB6